MRKKLLKQQFLLVLLTMLIAIPQGVWAEDYDLWIGDVQVTSENASNVLGDQETPTVVFTPAVNTNPATLTLNGATLEGTIVSSLSALTIHLEGENTLNGFISTEGDNNTLKFTHSENSSLSIHNVEDIISGFSDVDFGDLNLASNAPGVYYNDGDYFMAGPAGNPSVLTITTATYYPIWICDPQSDFGYTQLSEGSTSVTIGEGTVSFDGEHTITINKINFDNGDNYLIVVGQNMTELTVNLEQNSFIDNGIGISLWATTPLTFTTNASTPGSLTGSDIVSWKGNGNGQISYQNGLKVFYDLTSSYKKTISTTGTYIKIGDTEVKATRDITIAEGTAHFDASSNTLTLTGATIGGATAASDIKAYVDDLKVEISGTNRIYGNITYSGSNYQSSNIQINKESGAESANLTVSNVNGFKSCTWDNDLYLSAHNGENAVAVKYEYDSNTWKFCSYYSNTSFDNITLSTTASNTLWVNGISPDADGNFTGIENVTFTPASSTTSATLTLNGATINGKILSSCEALTISFSGENSLPETQGYIESTIPSAVLTLKGVATGQTASTLSLSNTVGKAAISGFASVNYDGAYVHYDDPFRYDTDSKEMKSVWGVLQSLTLSTLPSYKLWIGNTQVTDANKGNLTGANTPVATFTPASSENNNVNTITLSGATINGKIRSGLGDLTILVDGTENIINASDTGVVVRSVNAGTLTIKKKNTTASLTLRFDDFAVIPSPLIKDFAAVDYSTDGFYLKSERPAEYTTYTYVNDYDESLTTKGLVDPANPTSYLPSAEFTTTQTYPLWIIGEQVTTANASNILDEVNESNDEPTASYNATDGILTLNGATISTNADNPSPLIVCNGNLTVDLVGPSSIGFNNGSTYAFKNIGSTGELTFTSTSNTSEYGNYLSITSECYEGTYKGLCDGFTKVNFNNDLGLFNRSGSKTVGSIAGAAPIFDVVNTQQTCDLLVNSGLLLNATYHYKIDYVDETIEGNGVEVNLPLDETNHNISNVSLSISHPCTITAYAKMGETIISSNKAKLYGIADTTIVLNSTTLNSELNVSDLVIVPEYDATADGVSLSNLTIMRSENSGVVEYSEGTGKATIKALGVADLTVRAAVNGEEPKIKVLNQDGEVVMMTANVKVVPAAPTLTSNSTYIGDAITITTDVEGGTIYYSWDETDNVGTLYSETAPVAQNGTLYAWVSYYDATSKQTLLGAKAQQTFEVVNNIENAVVVGLANPATATYTGAAITPSFTVKASAEAEDNLVEGTDYTVRYEVAEPVQQQQPQAPRRAPEESESVTIKDAGGYNIIIEGKGEYGGTLKIGFTVNQANLANVTIAEIDAVTYTGADLTPTLTVTFGENAVDETEYTVKYEKGTAEVEAVVEPGQYDVTLTSTNKNFAANSTKSAKFNILPVAPTIAYNSEVTYLDTDEIEITAADGMKIFYTWETGDIFGSNEYNVTQDALMEYGTNTMPVATNGTLRAWAGYLLEDNIYLMSAEVTQAFTVKKDINNAAIYISAASATYTGAAITPEFTLKESEEEGAATISADNYTVRYEKADDKPQAPRRAPEESVTIKDAGDYLIIIEGKNEYGGTMEIPFEITQAENSLTTTPAAVAELIYTGDALELVTAGVAKFGDVLYKLGADGTYSATIPTATDANTTGYTVYYKVEGNDNYTGIEETSVVVTIDKATATITKAPAAKTLTYTGDALELVEAGTVSAGTMVYSTTIDGTFAEAIPTATNAGSYTVYYKVNGTDNYSGIEASETNKVTVTIGQAEITSVELVEATLPYNGEAQTPTIAKVMAGDIEVGAEYYEITGGNEKTAVGEYELTVAAKTMEGNNFKGSAKVAWSIVNRTLVVGEDVQFADGQKWASFYTPSEDLELPEGVMAYIVTGVNESEKSVTVKAVNKVLKSVPMLLENGSTETTTNVSAEGNLLQVATEATAVSSINGTVYGLYNNAMMRVTTGTIALGKCYLVVNGKQNAPRLTITKDDQATGIESLTPALSEGEGAWYTIDGKKLQQKPTKKGIYIVNGKKMVVNNK